MHNFLRIIICFLGLLFTSMMEACPCGCGAVNPQVLTPGESWRFYSAMTQEANFKAVTYEGELGPDGGPKVKRTLTLALAKAVNQDLSATLTMPLEQNLRPGEVPHYGLTDPSLSLRYMLYAQSFDKEWIPQVQGFVTYKHSFSRSIYDSEKNWQMDVHGNGFDEWVPGIDLWYGLHSFKAGITQTMILPRRRSVDMGSGSVVLTPGSGQKTVFTTGYNYPGRWQLLAGVERENRRPLKLDGVEMSDSDKIIHSVSGVFTYSFKLYETWGLSYKRTAAFAANKNTTRSDGVSLSYMRGF